MSDVMPAVSGASRGGLPRFGIVAALGVTMLWLAALVAAPSIGAGSYLAPLMLLVGLAIFAAARKIICTGDMAVLSLLFIATFGLNLDFRTRVAGETGLDWQNGLKLVAWTFMGMAIWVDRRAVIALLSRDPGCLLALAFCAVAALSALWSLQPALTAASAFGLFASLGFAGVVAVRMSPAVFQRTILLALGAEIVLGLVAYVLVPSIALLEPSEGEVHVRLQGLSGHPNLLGEHAALLLVFLVGVWEARVLARRWLVALGGAAAVALVASGSRTAAIAALVAIAVHFVRRYRLSRQALLAILGIGMVTAFAAAFGATGDLTDDLAGLTRSGSASELLTLTGRTDLWAIAWEHFRERPFLGWGFNGSEGLMLESVGATFVGNAVNAHNALLQALMTLGLVGTIPVIGFLSWLVRAFFAAPDPTRDRLFVFLIVLGIAEAELMTLPMTSIFLCFWCLARNSLDHASLSEPRIGFGASNR